ncbi:MAG: hypothetical protein ACREQ5_11480, partial [Candidatus Dormibacteria bacterium]
MVNCFVEKTASGALMSVKRPGLSASLQGEPGCGQGVVDFLGVLYSISNDTLTAYLSPSPAFTQVTPHASWSSRDFFLSTSFLGQLWVIGGFDGSNALSDVWSSLDGISWGKKTTGSFPARYDGQAIVFNNKLFIMGGFSTDGTALNDVWSSVDGGTWIQTNASAWPARGRFEVTVFNGKLWMIGGSDSTGSYYYSDVWSSVDGTIWVQVSATNPWVGRSRFGLVSFNGRLRLLAGELNPVFIGAGGDLWSSADGVVWTRDSSNPFNQAATGLYKLAALTSQGAEYSINPIPVTIAGSAVGLATVDDTDFEGSDSGGPILKVSITSAGSGYTSAPAIVLQTGEGVPATAYPFLLANGVAGDKRGSIVQSGTTLYFFGEYNNGAISDDLWSSTDGVNWTQ